MLGLYITHMWKTLVLPMHPRGCRGRDRMVFGFTTTYANSAYHH